MLIVQENGRMMASLCDARASVEGRREYIAYMGAWRLQDGRFHTDVDGTANPPWMGTDQEREIDWDGELLILRPPPRAGHGTMENRELVWERLS